MFNQDFYPTPAHVIEQIMMGENVSGKTILEPSAGSGNIVNWCNDHGAKQVLACEIEPRLRRMLSGCRLIGNDFLLLQSADVSHIDYIVMNPPFSRAEDHLRHAWEIAPAGCTVVCLMPTTVFSNMYSSGRKALKELVNLYGNITNLGAEFKNAERTTDVLVSVVKMYKEGSGEEEFADYFFDQTDMDDNGSGVSGMMGYNAVRDLVNRYKGAVERYDKAMAVAEEINTLTNFHSMLSEEKKQEYRLREPSSIRFGAYWVGNKKEENNEITRQIFKNQLKKDAWRFVFSLLDMRKYATNKLLEQIDKFVEQQSSVPFTMRNIYKMLDAIIQTNDQRMQTCLVDAFETICSFSYENSTAGEGWKTNSDYMVNRRFIVPNLASYDPRWPSSHVDCGWAGLEKWNKIEDVEKALCYLIGTAYPSDVSKTIRNQFRTSNALWGEWFECGLFFRCRAYKKGTVHFEFIDEGVWMKFNAAVAKAKGWNAIGTNSKNVKKKRHS